MLTWRVGQLCHTTPLDLSFAKHRSISAAATKSRRDSTSPDIAEAVSTRPGDSNTCDIRGEFLGLHTAKRYPSHATMMCACVTTSVAL